MKQLNIVDFFSGKEGRVLLDVRTPAEYAKGHIPGARNLPLFSNEERAVVGTIYKQENPDRAFQRGLDFAGAKMSWYVEEAQRLAPDRKVVIHCWRGGKRSSSIGWLLGFAGFEVEVLEGGYKAYRRFILHELEMREARLLILGGRTGSGKTEILNQLASLGEQIIDLEGLAHHKGSAFGDLGQAPQPSVEQFENNLFDAFHHLKPNKRIWLENESQSIGHVFLPAGFWKKMRAAPLIHLKVPFENRVQKLVCEYGKFSSEQLQAAFEKIKKRLGGQHLKTAIEALKIKDIDTAAAIALNYYDKSYDHATSKGQFCKKLTFATGEKDACEIAKKLIKLTDEHHF